MLERIEPPHKIYIAASKTQDAGRGVFAGEAIAKGTHIETCPVVLLPDRRDRDRLRKTGLVNYYFLWGDDRDRAAICLGWGSVYNHSFSPNARYEKSLAAERMDFYALRDIAAGEEITVNYNGAPKDTRRLRIPGIPAAFGGPQPSIVPWPLEGILRRMRLARAWLAGKSSPFIMLVSIPAF